MTEERVVVRMLDGSTIKGYLEDFTEASDPITVKVQSSGQVQTIPINDVKAIFFVKSFEGNPDYKEKKYYRPLPEKKRRIYVKFKDRETMLGYIEGELPWDKGFFLSSDTKDKKGFFMRPSDEGSNNRLIFVVASSVEDVALM